MGKRDPLLLLDDILESVQKIEQYIKGLTESQFASNFEKQDAVFRRFEIIGEAIKNLSPDIRKKHSHVPWKDIAGLRDILIHNYFGLFPGRIWKIILNDLPAFKRQVEEIRNTLSQ